MPGSAMHARELAAAGGGGAQRRGPACCRLTSTVHVLLRLDRFLTMRLPYNAYQNYIPCTICNTVALTKGLISDWGTREGSGGEGAKGMRGLESSIVPGSGNCS